MRRSIQYTVHVVVPLLVGGIIYITWRSETLRMFGWFESVQLDGAVYGLRDMYGGQVSQLPMWLLYSLPDAVWVYSFAMYMGLVWVDTNPRVAFSLSAIGPTLGIGGELGQAFGIVPGTFDVVDLLLLLAVSVIALVYLSQNKGIIR